MVRVSRCVCFDVSFAALRELAEAHDVRTLEELSDLRPFGRNCGLCRPYVAEMLRTGKTLFTEILPVDDGAER